MKRQLFRVNLVPLAALLIMGVIVTMFACQKTESNRSQPTSDLNTQFLNNTNFAVNDENLDDQDFEDAVALDEDAPLDNFNGSGGGGCKTITYDPSRDVYPHTKTIVYNNCTSECKGGTINGTKVITVYVNPKLAKPGDLVKEIVYQNFTVDDVQITNDTKTYLASNDPLTWHVVRTRTYVIGGKDGITQTSSSDLMRELIAGGDTQDNSDDMYAVTGTTTGVENEHGGGLHGKYTSVIDETDPATAGANCCWRTSGTETINIEVREKGSTTSLTEVLDYGDGTCDNQATLSINGGEAQAVTLPLYFWPLSQ
ncbi:MAG TPA: hypothetical protein VEV83_17985 [Parafilimonas sp.]|nr:hypothetical protein [Parafilimonas sp.]